MPKPHLGEFSFVDNSWLPMPSGGLAVAGPTDQTHMPTSVYCRDAQALQCMTAVTKGNGPFKQVSQAVCQTHPSGSAALEKSTALHSDEHHVADLVIPRHSCSSHDPQR